MGIQAMVFRRAKTRRASFGIDEHMLDRLVSYEAYVESHFGQLAKRRCLEKNPDIAQEYEQLKDFKSYISSLVDLAFYKYGVQSGLMKNDSGKPIPALGKDLDALVEKLQSTVWKSKHFNRNSVARHEPQVALVV
jgi:hypothetical protein